jgi:hypothetical protein
MARTKKAGRTKKAAREFGKDEPSLDRANRRTHTRPAEARQPAAHQATLVAPSFARWSLRREQASLNALSLAPNRVIAGARVVVQPVLPFSADALGLARSRVLARARIASLASNLVSADLSVSLVHVFLLALELLLHLFFDKYA